MRCSFLLLWTFVLYFNTSKTSPLGLRERKRQPAGSDINERIRLTRSYSGFHFINSTSTPLEAASDYFNEVTKGKIRGTVRKFRLLVSDQVDKVARQKSPSGIVYLAIGEIKNERTAPHSCIAPPGLTLEGLEWAMKVILGRNNFQLQRKLCSKGAKRYENIGGSCVEKTTDLLEILYWKSVVLMLLGATRTEAFSPFLHFRVLSSNLAACHPEMNPVGTTAFPHTYAGLYELYVSRLISKLMSSSRLRFSVSSKEIESIVPLVTPRMSNAIYTDLDKVLHSSSFPTDSEIGEVIHSSMAEVSSRFLSTRTLPSESLNSSLERHIPEFSRNGIQLKTERLVRCNAGLGETNAFFYHHLPHAKNKYENCCIRACLTLWQFTRSPRSSLSSCCSGCNRRRCSADGKRKAEMLASVAEIVSPRKMVSPPAMYTFVV